MALFSEVAHPREIVQLDTDFSESVLDLNECDLYGYLNGRLFFTRRWDRKNLPID